MLSLQYPAEQVTWSSDVCNWNLVYGCLEWPCFDGVFGIGWAWETGANLQCITHFGCHDGGAHFVCKIQRLSIPLNNVYC
jgi:hypothetical protein